MELTPGILKSVESGIYTTQLFTSMYAVRYKGKIFNHNSNVRLFLSPSSAKTAITKFLVELFRQGEYWQRYKDNLKTRTGYDADFSETIRIFPSLGKSDRFDSNEFKKMIKDLRDKLLEEKVFTIDEIL
jgi:hypothetical protein